MNRRPSHPTQAAAAFAARLQEAALVIFDFDGVIADSEVISLSTLQGALAAFGVKMSLDETRARFLGTSLRTITAHVAQYGSGHAQKFATVWEDALFPEMIARLNAVPGAFDLLDHLDTINRAFCIASSSRFARLDHALQAMGQAGRVPHIFSAQQVKRGKPAPDLFEFAAAEMGAAPDACLVIEDSPHGVRAAKAAGMACVGFTGGSHLQSIRADHGALLQEAGADLILPCYDGITRFNLAK